VRKIKRSLNWVKKNIDNNEPLPEHLEIALAQSRANDQPN
jgi:hypothetical protein